MPKKVHKPEEIVAKLRQVDVLLSQTSTVADAIRDTESTEMSTLAHVWTAPFWQGLTLANRISIFEILFKFRDVQKYLGL